MSIRDFARRSLVAGLCLSLTFYSSAVIPPAAAQSPDYSALLADFYDRIDEARSALDRRSFDVDAVADDLAIATPEEILAWQRATVAFEQYPGLLRGAKGTLQSRAGNALDQAVLFATLLGDAGYDTRIVEGRLSEDDARRLVLRMSDQRPETQVLSEGALAAISKARESAARALAAGQLGSIESEPPRLEDLAARAEGASEAVAALLAENGLAEGASVLAGLVAEAQDYFWVEYRLGPADNWRPGHPVFADGTEPTPAEVTGDFAGSVPARLQHRIRIDIAIEQRLGGKLKVQPLLSGWERPVANLIGDPLTISTFPVSLDGYADLEDPIRHVTENGLFVTLFRDEVASGKAFDINGNLVPLAEAASVAGALFKTVGDKAGSAASAIGALGSDKVEDLQVLTAEWVDFTLIAPDGSQRVFRRMLLDRLGAEARASGNFDLDEDRRTFLPLFGTRSAMIAVGGSPSAYVADVQLAAQVGYRAAAEQAAAQMVAFDTEIEPPRVEGPDPEAVSVLELFQQFDLAPGGDAIAYRAEPSLAMIGSRLVEKDGVVVVERFTDVIRNSRRVLAAADGDIVADVAGAVRAGVWETASEGAFLSSGFWPHPQEDYMTRFEAARMAGRGMVVLKPGVAGLPALADYGPVAADAMRRDLDAGYWLLTLAPESGREASSGWWRVRPDTGETLGMLEDGRGAAVEYVLLLGGIAIGGFLIYSHHKQQECLESVRGQAGYDFKQRDPEGYKNAVANCGWAWIWWSGLERFDREVAIDKAKCEENFAYGMFSPTCRMH